MDIEQAISAMQNLGVSLNDYDSEALDTMINFCFDATQPHDDHNDQEWSGPQVIESLREQLSNMMAVVASVERERDELLRDLNEVFEKSKPPYLTDDGYRLSYAAMEKRFELAWAERKNAFAAVAILKEQLAAMTKERDELVLALEWYRDNAYYSQQAELVAWLYYEHGEAVFGHPDGYRPDDATPLYTSPPAAVPLEEVREMVRGIRLCGRHEPIDNEIADLIERLAGIKES